MEEEGGEEPPPLSARSGIGRAGGDEVPSTTNGVLVSPFQGFCPFEIRRLYWRTFYTTHTLTHTKRPATVHVPTFPACTCTYIKAAAHRSLRFIRADGGVRLFRIFHPHAFTRAPAPTSIRPQKPRYILLFFSFSRSLFLCLVKLFLSGSSFSFLANIFLGESISRKSHNS